MNTKEFFTRIGAIEYFNDDTFMKGYKSGHITQGFVRKLLEHNNEKDVMLFAIEEGFSYEHLGPALKADKDIALVILKRTPEFYRELPLVLREDEDIARKAFSKGYGRFSAMPEELRGKKELVMLPFQYGKQNSAKVVNDEIECLPEHIRADRDFGELAVASNGFNLRRLSNMLKDDEELARLAIANRPGAYSDISERLQNDRAMIVFALEQPGGNVFKEIPTKHKKDPELIKIALQHSPQCFQNVPKAMRGDAEIAAFAVQTFPDNINHVPGEAVTKQLVIDALEVSKKCYRYLPDQFKDDFEVCLKAFQNDISRIHYATDTMKSFLEQYPTFKEKISALEAGAELQRKNLQVSLSGDVFAQKELVDLREGLQTNLVWNQPSKTKRMKL